MTDRRDLRALVDRLPVSPRFWRSPLRGTWLTSLLGAVLLAGVPLLFVTGLLSYAAYNPDLSPLNDKTPDKGPLGFAVAVADRASFSACSLEMAASI